MLAVGCGLLPVVSVLPMSLKTSFSFPFPVLFYLWNYPC